MDFTPYVLLVAAFLLGSIPFGLFIAKSKGIDIRSVGSGNIGATNVFRGVGKKAGLLCFLLDILKGAIPVILAINILGIEGKSPVMQFDFLEGFRTIFPEAKRTLIQTFYVLTGLFSVLGHNYSPWVGFKGGKGIATSAGVILALMPVGFVLLILLWTILTFSTRYVAIGSIGASIAFPLIVLWGAMYHKVDKADPDSPTLWEAGLNNKPLLIFSIVSGSLAVWKHRSNIQRLMNGTENRFGKKKVA